jgi:hypothetical protein
LVLVAGRLNGFFLDALKEQRSEFLTEAALEDFLSILACLSYSPQPQQALISLYLGRKKMKTCLIAAATIFRV